MDIVTRIRLSLLILAFLISLVTTFYYAIKGKKTPMLRSFILYLVLFEIWFLGQVLRIFSPNHRMEWIFVRFEYLGICFIGLVWLIFCLRYTENRWVNKRTTQMGLSLIPAISYGALLTNDWHHLFFKASDQAFNSYGSLFYLHAITSYLYITLGAFVLIQYSFYQYDYKRKQVSLLVLAAVLPLFINVLIVADVLTVKFDITPFCLMVSLALYFIATYKYKLLDLVPIARRRIVDTMNEAICVIDRFNQIVDYNHAFIDIFPELADLKEPNFDDLSKVLLERTEKDSEIQQLISGIRDHPDGQLSVEIKLIVPYERWLALKMQPLHSRKELLGQVISLSDISRYKSLAEELHQKNNELLGVNQQLREYAATIEELAVVKERNRFARDVHDTLGQTMTLLITLLQLSSMYCQTDPKLAEKKLGEAIKVAEYGLAEVKRSLTGIAAVELNSQSLLLILQNLISSYENIGMRCYLTVEGFQGNIEFKLADTIYRVCQEALTNSMRHGKAKAVHLRITFDDNGVDLSVKDDGCGCAKITMGYGLLGMESRVKAINGEIGINTGDGEGFHIQARIPVNH